MTIIKSKTKAPNTQNNNVCAYSKITNPTNNESFYIQSYDVTFGNQLSKVSSNKIKVNFHLDNCSTIDLIHFKIKFCFIKRKFCIMVLGRLGIYINNLFYSKNTEEYLRSKDTIKIPCDLHKHNFVFLLPKKNESQKELDAELEKNYGDICISLNKKSVFIENNEKLFQTNHIASWENKERDKFLKAILCLGYHRPVAIKKMAALGRKSIIDIERYSHQFIKVISLELKESTIFPFIEKVIKLENLNENTGSNIDCSLINWDEVKKNAKEWALQIRRLLYLTEIMVNHKLKGIDILNNFKKEDMNKFKPTDWWTNDDDRYLLTGTYKHGFSKYKKIFEKIKFKFCGNVKIVDNISISNITKKYLSINPEILDKRVVELLDSNCKEIYTTNVTNSILNSEYYINSKKRSSRLDYNKEKNILASSKKNKTKNTSLENSEDLKSKNLITDDVWSKKDKVSFFRIIMQFGLPKYSNGLPNWSFFREKGDLTQTNEELSKRYKEVMDECRTVIEGDAYSGDVVGPIDEYGENTGNTAYGIYCKDHRQELKSKYPEKTFGELNGKLGEQWKKLNSNLKKVYQERANKYKKRHKAHMIAHITTGKTELMSLAFARKMNLRIELMENIRLYLVNNVKGLKLYSPSGDYMPNWWSVGYHDMLFIEGVYKYGIGQWNKIFDDRAMNWPWNNYKSIRGENCPKPSPKICTKRLKKVVQYVTKNIKRRID